MDHYTLPLEIVPEHIRLTGCFNRHSKLPPGRAKMQSSREFCAECDDMAYYGSIRELAEILGKTREALSLAASRGSKVGHKWKITPTGEMTGSDFDGE